tara:strand:+ start:2534 stop:3184 length:651 start_codon:yes stop_codon:yes gene_type:complete
MNENICLPKSYFLIIILLFVLFTYLHGFNMKNLLNNNVIVKESESVINNIEKSEVKSDNDYPKNIKKSNNQKDKFINKRILLKERDEDALENSFSPPERRVSFEEYPYGNLRNRINVPSRGYPDSYHNIGLLSRNADEKIYNLFGRQKFPGSNQWEYYISGRDTNGNAIKIPLEITRDKELYNGDLVSVPILDNSKGKLEVKLFDYDVPRYNPHVF